jgi:hypothetical protein
MPKDFPRLSEDDKTKLAWNLPRVLMPRTGSSSARAADCGHHPRGGCSPSIRRAKSETIGFGSGSGLKARVPQAMPGLLTGEPGGHAVEARMPFSRSLPACFPGVCGLAIRPRLKASRCLNRGMNVVWPVSRY